MEKTATLNLRINPEVKKDAEAVLKQLGVPLSTAIDMYLRQIVLTGSIPFAVSLPDVPRRVDADAMSVEELRAEILKGIEDIDAGNVQDAKAAFEEFRRNHR